MPFRSKAQRRFMYSQHPEMAKRWEKHTPDKSLPEKITDSSPKETKEKTAMSKNLLAAVLVKNAMVKFGQALGMSPPSFKSPDELTNTLTGVRNSFAGLGGQNAAPAAVAPAPTPTPAPAPAPKPVTGPADQASWEKWRQGEFDVANSVSQWDPNQKRIADDHARAANAAGQPLNMPLKGGSPGTPSPVPTGANGPMPAHPDDKPPTGI